MYDQNNLLWLTHGIVHAGFSGLRTFVARKKGRCKLIGNCLVIPHDTIPSTVGINFKRTDTKMIVIGDKEFSYKKDALTYFKDILNSYEPIQILNESDFKDLVGLIENRPDKDEKIGCGIESIQVIEVRYKTKCFELIRTDGSKEVFSYRNCINGKSKPLTKFSKTCRETINDDLRNVKLTYFKKFSSKGEVKCQETGELCKWEELNVDHRQPNTFSVIVDRFIEVHRIDINAVQYDEIMDGVYHFTDVELAENFKKYHREKANLRLVKKGRNLGRSHQARTNRQKKDLTID